MTNFMTICPRSKSYTGCNLTGIPLKVIHDDGVEVSPHISFSEFELEKGVKGFHNNSGKSDSFSITVIINENDTIMVTKEFTDWTGQEELLQVLRGQSAYDTILSTEVTPSVYTQLGKHIKVIDALDYFIRKGEPFYITTRAVGIKSNELWMVTEQKSRKQKYDDGYIELDLTFTKYVSYKYASFKNTNKSVANAIKKYKNKSKAKQKTTAKYKLKKKCKPSQLKYSKKKKKVTCVKYMQKILYKKGFIKKKKQIDGWFGDTTRDALKKFQKKYKKKYKLKVNGKVDKNTFKALYSV